MSAEKIKPILISPPPELRLRIEQEAKRQNRSMNNLLVVILTKVFKVREENGAQKE